MAPAALFGDSRAACVRTGGEHRGRRSEARPLSLCPSAPTGRPPSRQLQPACGSKGRGGNAPLAHPPNFSGRFLFLLMNYQLALGSPAQVGHCQFSRAGYRRLPPWPDPRPSCSPCQLPFGEGVLGTHPPVGHSHDCSANLVSRLSFYQRGS